jgi:hypothetical protein
MLLTLPTCLHVRVPLCALADESGKADLEALHTGVSTRAHTHTHTHLHLCHCQHQCTCGFACRRERGNRPGGLSHGSWRTHRHPRAHTYIHTYIHTDVHTHTHRHACAHTHTHTHTHTHIHAHADESGEIDLEALHTGVSARSRQAARDLPDRLQQLLAGG